jgi:Ca2+/Na+ antiporter
MTTTTNRAPGGRAGLWTLVAARTAAAVVALVAGAASFEHIASVAIAAGERPWVAYSLPAAIDGLIVVGVMALIEDQRQARTPRRVARLAVATGVAATLAANLASAHPTWTARLVALAAPVSFLLSVEVLTRTGRKLSTPDDTTTVPQPVPATTPAGQAAVARARTRPAAPRRRTTAAARVAQAATQTPTATAAEIAARLGISERTVQRYRPHPTPPVNGTGPADLTPRAGVVAVPGAPLRRPGLPARADTTAP